MNRLSYPKCYVMLALVEVLHLLFGDIIIKPVQGSSSSTTTTSSIQRNLRRLTSSTTLTSKTNIRTLQDTTTTDANTQGPSVPHSASTSPISSNPAVRLGFIGNSMQYYNDSPRLIEQMILSSGITVSTDSCFIGGSSLLLLADGICSYQDFYGPVSNIELFIDTDGTATYVQTSVATVDTLVTKYTNKDPKDGYDFIILNDNSQGPARVETLNQGIMAIKDTFAPLLKQSGRRGRIATPVLIQTAAYKIENIQGSDGLGDFYQFTDKIANGLNKYVKLFDEVFAQNFTSSTRQRQLQEEKEIDSSSSSTPPVKARIAPVGEAYKYLYDNDRTLFDKLYVDDNYHPSPYGTYLQACIVFLTCFPEILLPTYNPQWWTTTRFFTDDNNFLKPIGFPNLPSTDDAVKLQNAAIAVMAKIPMEDDVSSTSRNNNDSSSSSSSTSEHSSEEQLSDQPSSSPTEQTIDNQPTNNEASSSSSPEPTPSPSSDPIHPSDPTTNIPTLSYTSATSDGATINYNN